MNHIRAEHISNQDIGSADLLDLAVRNTPAWHADAACKEAAHTTSWFSDSRKVTAEAVKVCRECLALEDCRSWALDQGAWLRGVWGGLTESDRRKARRSGWPGTKAPTLQSSAARARLALPLSPRAVTEPGCSRGAAPEFALRRPSGAHPVAREEGQDPDAGTFDPVVPDHALFQ